MEIEAQKVTGSRRYSKCMAEFHSRVDMSLAALQAPGLQGGTLSGIIGQGPALACSWLCPGTGLNMGTWSQSVPIRDCVAHM